MTIAQRLGDRLRRASEQATEFKTTYHQTLPLVERGAAELERLHIDLVRLAEMSGKLWKEVSLIHGYMQEGERIADEHWDDVAQAATLAVNFDVFFQGDPKLLAHILKTVDLPVLEDALEKIPSERLVLVQRAIQRVVGDYSED